MNKKLTAVMCGAAIVLTTVVSATAAERTMRIQAPMLQRGAAAEDTDAAGGGFGRGFNGMRKPPEGDIGFKAGNTEQIAERLGIDITGMTDEEAASAIEEALAAKRDEMQAAAAEKRAEMLAELKAQLTEAGVDVTGMTDWEICAAAREQGIFTGGLNIGRNPEDGSRPFGGFMRCTPQALAQMLGIDATDMTNDELAEALAEAVKQWCKDYVSAEASSL